jgi:hypothetical protein
MISIISIVVYLILIGVALYLVNLIPMDATIRKVIQVIVIVLVILAVLQAFGLLDPLGTLGLK